MIKDLKLGDKALLSRTFTEEDVMQFATLSTDTCRLHLDKSFAETTIFGQRVIHGMLVASLFSGLIGTKLSGELSIYLGQSLSFKEPVFIGDRVTASVEIIKICEDKPIVTLRTICVNDKVAVVIEGEAVVKVM